MKNYSVRMSGSALRFREGRKVKAEVSHGRSGWHSYLPITRNGGAGWGGGGEGAAGEAEGKEVAKQGCELRCSTTYCVLGSSASVPIP